MAATAASPAPAPHVADVIVEGNANFNAPPDVATTSVARRGLGFDEVTMRFVRWATHGNTAYQKGQHAGFRIAEARELERRGVAFIVTDLAGPSRMVTK